MLGRAEGTQDGGAVACSEEDVQHRHLCTLEILPPTLDRWGQGLASAHPGCGGAWACPSDTFSSPGWRFSQGGALASSSSMAEELVKDATSQAPFRDLLARIGLCVLISSPGDFSAQSSCRGSAIVEPGFPVRTACTEDSGSRCSLL